MTNSHDDLHKIVTQKEKDRTISNAVEVIQAVAGDLNSRVTQLEKDRTVTNAVAANLKSEVIQAAKDRTVTGSVTAAVTGIVTTEKGDTNYTKVRKRGYYTTQQTNTILWDPTSGKKFVITDISVSVDTAMMVSLKEEALDIIQWHFAVNGGAVLNLQTPYESIIPDYRVLITTNAVGKCSITVSGYEV